MPASRWIWTASSLGVDAKVIMTPPLYILYGKSLMKHTGWCQNDFNVQGYSSRPTEAARRWVPKIASESASGCATRGLDLRFQICVESQFSTPTIN